MLANWVKETTATTGTGTVTTSALTGYQRFSDAFNTGQSCFYHIRDGNNFEAGIGTVGVSNTLARTTIFETWDSGVRTLLPVTGLNLSGSAQVWCDHTWQYLPNQYMRTLAAASVMTCYTKTGDVIDVTGTATITDITSSSARAGHVRFLRFNGVCTLTNSSGLVLPGGADITTASGDVAVFVAYSPSIAVCFAYQRANGQAVIPALPLAGGTMTGAIALSNNTITGAKYIGFNGEVDCGNSGSGLTVDFQTGQDQKVTLNNASPTITLANGPAVGHYQLKVIQDGTGSRAPSWAGTNYSASRWLGSTTAPSVNSTASSETIVNFYWDGSKWYQSMVKVGA